MLLYNPPRSPKVTTFTASGTFTRDPASTYAIAEFVGAGGAGGYGFGQAGANTVYLGLGGGSGAYVKVLLTAAQLGTSQPVTIGVGATTSATATSLGTLAVANGGQSGSSRYANSASTGLTSVVNTPSVLTRATFTIVAGVDLGSQLGNLPSAAFGSSGTNGTCSIDTSNGADSAMGKGAIGQKSANNPNTVSAPGGFNAISPTTNTGGGASGDATFSPNASLGVPSATAIGGSGFMRITEYFV